METFSETRSKYFAFSFTIGIHLLVILAFLLMGFVNPIENKVVMETSCGEQDMFGLETVDLTDLVVSSKSPSSEKLISDPNEKDFKIVSGNANSSTETSNSAESQEYQTVLNRMKRFKKSKGQEENSGGDDLKDRNSLKQNNFGFENDGTFILSNRSLVVKPETILNDAEEGKVVVEIIVDESGKVISALPGQRGSTTTSAALYQKAVKSAYTAQFNPSKDEIKEQRGTYTFVFTLE